MQNDNMQGVVSMQPLVSFRDSIAVVGGDKKTRTFQAVCLVSDKLNSFAKAQKSEAYLLGVGYTFYFDKTSEEILELIANQNAGHGMCFVMEKLDPYLQSRNCFSVVEYVKN